VVGVAAWGVVSLAAGVLGLGSFGAFPALSAVTATVGESLTSSSTAKGLLLGSGLFGVASGFFTGLLRLALRARRARRTESFIGGFFSGSVFKQLPNGHVLSTLLTNAAVGYSVGLLMHLAGVSFSLSGFAYTGPTLVFLSASGGGGAVGGLISFVLFALVLVLYSVVIAVATAITLNLLVALCAAALGGSLKGVAKQLTLAGLEEAWGLVPSRSPEQVFWLIVKDGLFTGLVVGTISGFLYSLGAAERFDSSNALGLVFFLVFWLLPWSISELQDETKKP
jgi:hypothetical protein